MRCRLSDTAEEYAYQMFLDDTATAWIDESLADPTTTSEEIEWLLSDEAVSGLKALLDGIVTTVQAQPELTFDEALQLQNYKETHHATKNST